MDSNAALAVIREFIVARQAGNDLPPVANLIDACDALDMELSHGGPLPAPWAGYWDRLADTAE